MNGISDAVCGYFVNATILTVLFQSCRNFAGVLFMVWTCTCDLDIIVTLNLFQLNFSLFSASQTQRVGTLGSQVLLGSNFGHGLKTCMCFVLIKHKLDRHSLFLEILLGKVEC